MSNKNYINGAAKERRIVNKYRKDGWVSFRSAGSHSSIDICAINKDEKKIVFLQSKPKKFSKNKAKQLEDELNWLNDEFLVSFKVV